MNKCLEQKISFIFGATFAFMIAILLMCMITEASTRTGYIGDRYLHKTKSAMYDRGEPTRNAYRWRGGRLYYYGNNGRQLRHSTKYIKVSKGHVDFIYVPGTNHNERYNVKHRRYQKRKRNGHWADIGQQTNVWWMCDLQE
jgi:hypothetical protein